jgi:hypothetical protein
MRLAAEHAVVRCFRMTPTTADPGGDVTIKLRFRKSPDSSVRNPTTALRGGGMLAVKVPVQSELTVYVPSNGSSTIIPL